VILIEKKLASGLGNENGQNKREFLLRNGRVGERYDGNGKMVMGQFQHPRSEILYIWSQFLSKNSLFVLTESTAFGWCHYGVANIPPLPGARVELEGTVGVGEDTVRKAGMPSDENIKI
jgi:hypothetical protein